MVIVREATEQDVSEIKDIYLAVYGKGYPYQEFYDEHWLKKSVFSDDFLMLVAEEKGKLLGTASVVFDIGAFSDLVGEFGRLAVFPEARKKGVGTLLMEKRIEAIQDRLHLGIIAARVAHAYAQKIAERFQFAPVGFLPFKHIFQGGRESLALLGRYFGNSTVLRKNNPRIIPEVYPLADKVLNNLSLPRDLVVDEESSAYPIEEGFTLEQLEAEGLPPLLRIERGRVRNREIFGHMRLEYGFFKIRVGKANYLLARSQQTIVGAVGFTFDPVEHLVRVFELIASTDQVIRFLLFELEKKSMQEWNAEYLEIDVSAFAPRMQRTLLELNFLPVAYIPAMVFHDVERLDIIRMARLKELKDLGKIEMTPSVERVASVVMEGFKTRTIAPRIARAVSEIPFFKGLNSEQLARFSNACTVTDFEKGAVLFSEGSPADKLYIMLKGRVGIRMGHPPAPIGKVEKGETLGELSFFSSASHSASAEAETPVEAVVLHHKNLTALARQRPDIGLTIYKTIAAGLGEKLLRSDISLRESLLGESKKQ